MKSVPVMRRHGHKPVAKNRKEDIKMFERGSIYYINNNAPVVGSEQSAGRPAIIVSNDKNNNHSSVLEVVYLTTQPKTDLPTHVDIRSSQRPSTALCESVYSISVDRIGNYIGACTDSEMERIDTALLISLGITPAQKPIPQEEITPVYDSDPAVIIKLETERDIYKNMYEQLLERVMKGGINNG